MNYIKHKVNQGSDERMLNLTFAHGAEGIGAYWTLVETLYQRGGTASFDSLDRLAFNLRCSEAVIRSVIEDFGLFKYNDTDFWSDDVQRAIETNNNVTIVRRKAAKNRWNAVKARPTIDEVKAYAVAQCMSIDAEEFYDYYDARGWKINGTILTNWQAALRGWQRRNDKLTATSNIAYTNSEWEQH